MLSVPGGRVIYQCCSPCIAHSAASCSALQGLAPGRRSSSTGLAAGAACALSAAALTFMPASSLADMSSSSSSLASRFWRREGRPSCRQGRSCGQQVCAGPLQPGAKPATWAAAGGRSGSNTSRGLCSAATVSAAAGAAQVQQA